MNPTAVTRIVVAAIVAFICVAAVGHWLDHSISQALAGLGSQR